MRRAFFVLSVLLLLSLCGCWSYSELNERTIVAGAAIDRAQSGEICCTVETVEFGGGSASEGKSVLTSGRGASLSDAIYDVMNQSGKRLYWDQAALLILGQGIAEEGIRPLLDYVLSEHGMRLTLLLAVSRLETAAEVFELKAHGARVKSLAIASIIEEQCARGRTVRTNVHEALRCLTEPGLDFALPQIMSVEDGKHETAEVSGCAVFRGDGLAGFLDQDETLPLQLLRGEAEEIGLDLLAEGLHVSVELSGPAARLRPHIEEGAVRAELEFSADYEVMSADGDFDYRNEEALSALEEAMRRAVVSRVMDLTEQTGAWGSDVLGIGYGLWQHDPRALQALPDRHAAVRMTRIEVRTDFTNRTRINDSTVLFGV